MFVYNITDSNEYLKPVTEIKINRKVIDKNPTGLIEKNKSIKKKKKITQKNNNFLKSLGLKLKQ